MVEENTLLNVRGLRTVLTTAQGIVTAVDGVSFQVRRGEVLGLVGESGCGKTMTALSLLRLVPEPQGRIVGGAVRFNGHDLLALPERMMQTIRGRRIAMIFQEPMMSLNPVFTVGNQIEEMLRLHLKMSKSDARSRAVELLRQVGMPDPARRVLAYPHQLSGGMRQRVMIAMAISCQPDLVIADEPTTALDVTIQAQILSLLDDLRHQLGMAMILISHDLGIIAQIADAVAIMYAGRIVEYAQTEALFDHPLHPYTTGLLRSLPRFDSTRRTRMTAIAGAVPKLSDLPRACHFAPRCPDVMPICSEKDPPLEEIAAGHQARCWLHIAHGEQQ